MKSKRTVKRKLSDISFEKEGAHVALVSKDQGGPANGHDYTLVMKANNFSQEYIEKIQQVQVTMEFPEFLRKFFNLYYEDAEVLARFLGYVPEEKEEEFDYDDYIQDKVDSFKVLKSLYEAENLEIALGKLTQEEALLVKQSQAKLEVVLQKNSANADEGSTEAVAKAKKSDDETNAVVEPSGANTNVEENSMDEEKVEKAVLIAVEKSLEETKADLQKANARIAEFEAKEKEAITKAKTSVIQDVLKDEKATAVIAKAALLIDGDDFTAFVDVLKGLMNKVEKSALFEEQGASGESSKNDVKESPVAKALKAELAKSTQKSN